MLALVGIVIAARSGVASADDAVVVVASPHVPILTGLVAQIHVHTEDRVIVGTTDDIQDVAAFASAAPRLLSEHHAALVVWTHHVTSASGEATWIVYVAGRAADRAVAELVRVDASVPRSDVERTLALKIASLLDDLLETHAAAVVGQPVDRRPTWSLAIGGGPAVGGSRGVVYGPSIAVWRRLATAPFFVDAQINARWHLEKEIADRVLASIEDVAITVGAAIGRRAGALDVRLGARVGGVLASAEAVTTDGRRGSASEIVPLVALEVGASAPVSERVRLGVSVETEAMLIHQRFRADDLLAVDLGRWGVGLQACAIVALD